MCLQGGGFNVWKDLIQAKRKQLLCSWKPCSGCRQLWAFPPLALAAGYFANVFVSVCSPCNSLLSSLRSWRDFILLPDKAGSGHSSMSPWLVAWCFSLTHSRFAAIKYHNARLLHIAQPILRETQPCSSVFVPCMGQCTLLMQEKHWHGSCLSKSNGAHGHCGSHAAKPMVLGAQRLRSGGPQWWRMVGPAGPQG